MVAAVRGACGETSGSAPARTLSRTGSRVKAAYPLDENCAKEGGLKFPPDLQSLLVSVTSAKHFMPSQCLQSLQ